MSKQHFTQTLTAISSLFVVLAFFMFLFCGIFLCFILVWGKFKLACGLACSLSSLLRFCLVSLCLRSWQQDKKRLLIRMTLIILQLTTTTGQRSGSSRSSFSSATFKRPALVPAVPTSTSPFPMKQFAPLYPPFQAPVVPLVTTITTYTPAI